MWKKNSSSWLQTFAMFWMSYAFFRVVSRRLCFKCQRFGTPCLFHFIGGSVWSVTAVENVGYCTWKSWARKIACDPQKGVVGVGEGRENSLWRQTNALRFYEINSVIYLPSTCLGHSCGNLQGGKCENTNILIVCQDHSTVKITWFGLNGQTEISIKY
jgi:hypothetical protein